MRKLKYLILPLLFFTSCVEDVDFEIDQYVKVLSIDGSSLAEKIIELDNGDLMILGEMGTSAFAFESTSGGSQINALEDQSPFLAITDPNGNLKSLRMYPFEGLEADSPFGPFEILNFQNTTTFQNAVVSQDGGYVVHAQSLGFDFVNPVTNEIEESMAGSPNYNDFLLKLDVNLNIEEVRTMQAYPGWDGITRIRGKLKSLPNNEIGFLLSQRRPLGQENSTGFTFLHLEDDMDTIEVYDVSTTTDLIGYDFAYSNGDLKILGTTVSFFELFECRLDQLSYNNLNSTQIAGDGVLDSQNTDENYILELQDGTLGIVYTDPAREIFYDRRGAGMMSIGSRVSIGDPDDYPTFTIRATRAVTQASNGDILIYVLVLPGNEGASIYGELFRIALNGRFIFKIDIDGIPGDVIELSDGSIITASNAVYNGSVQRIHLTKMNANGEIF